MKKDIFDLGLSQLIEAGVKNICLSGGEALLHPDILYFIEEIKRNNLHLRLYTNAQNVTEELCIALKDADLSPVSITIYSTCDEIHDAITQSSGSLRKTIEGIKLFEKHQIPIQISVPVLKSNIKSFKALFNYCKSELKVDAFGPNPFISYTINHQRTNQDVVPSKKEIKDFAMEYYCIAIENGFNIIPHKTLVSWENYHLYDGAELTIQFDGTIVAGVLMSDIVLGKVQTDKLLNIWNNSPLLNEWRCYKLEKNDECSSCRYLALCQPNVGDNWVANHDMLKLDKHWCDCNKEYYSNLFEWSDGGKFLVEVVGKPGFVFCPSEVKEENGQKTVKAYFNDKIAQLKYMMTVEGCNEARKKEIIVQIN